VRGVLVGFALFGLFLVAGCGAQPWHPAHHLTHGTYDSCGSAISPDRTEVLGVCYDGGSYTCFETNGDQTDAFSWREISFSGDCKGARAALQKYDYIP
jgi:hypothetical protein